MAWHRLGDKPLSEPMMVSLMTHICVTRPQWVKHGLDSIRLPLISVSEIGDTGMMLTLDDNSSISMICENHAYKSNENDIKYTFHPCKIHELEIS